MKKLLTNYVFAPSSGKVTFLDDELIQLEQVLLITNVSTNTIIYSFADTLKGGTITDNALTFDFDVSGMSANDKLQIFIEVEEQESELHLLLRRMIKMLESNTTVDNMNRQRVNMDNTYVQLERSAGSNVGVYVAAAANHGNTSTSINPYAVGGIQNIVPITEWPVDQRWRIIHEARTAYATGIRNNLIS